MRHLLGMGAAATHIAASNKLQEHARHTQTLSYKNSAWSVQLEEQKHGKSLLSPPRISAMAKLRITAMTNL